MLKKACIFDLDGVICHTDQFHYLAWKELSEELGLRFDKEMNNHLRGVSRRRSFEIILELNNTTLPENTILESIEKKNNLYRKYLEKMKPSDLESDVIPVLLDLKNSGFLLAIGSSSKNALFILEKLEITNYFDAIVDGNAIKNSKPDPEVFLKAAEKLGAKACNCTVIEDAVSGIEAAINAGMNYIPFRLSSNGTSTYSVHAENFNDVKRILLSRN